MRRFARAVLAALMVAAVVVSGHEWHKASRPIVIGFNPGGYIAEFVLNFDELRRSRRNVIIDGICISACTLITGLVPASRVCVTPFAKLAFHSAAIGPGVFSREGTRLAWRIYPEKVRALLRSRGWDGDSDELAEHPSLIYVEGDDLLSIFNPCV